MLRIPASSHQEIIVADPDLHIESTSLRRRVSTGDTQPSVARSDAMRRILPLFHTPQMPKRRSLGHSMLALRLQAFAIGPEQQPRNKVETEDQIAR